MHNHKHSIMHNKQQKLVFVTGCSTGIGLDIVKTLKTRGYKVLASCRKPADVDTLLQQGIDCIELDLADSAAIQSALHYIQKHGELYALVNNGAFGVPGAVEDLSRAALQFQFETNVFGTHELTRGCLALMLARNEGRIIQISSILGGLCLPFRGAYNASKYALEGLSDTMRLELSDTNIHISLLQPGPIASQFRANALANFKHFVDGKNSRFQAKYAGLEERLTSATPVPFTLPASAVTDSVIHALEANKPRIRYRITRPTKVLLPLKRILPDRWMDKLLQKIG